MSGMNMARIACAYGNQKELELLISRIRSASIATKRLCGIILETHGSHVMVGPVTPLKKNGGIKVDERPITPLNLLPHSQSNDLKMIASALNMKIDKLPQNIVQNASFAMNHIIKSHQVTPNSSPEQTNEQSKESEDMATSMNKNENKIGKESDSVIFPFHNIAHSQSPIESKSNSSANNLTLSPPQIQSNLSYDGKSFIFQPDIHLTEGSIVRIITDRVILGDNKKFSICLPSGLINKLCKNQEIIIYPSIKLKIKCIEKKPNILSCLVLNGGPLKEYSKVEFPSFRLSQHSGCESLTQQDVSDIGFCVQHFVDYLCVSHVKSVKDIISTKEILEIQNASLFNLHSSLPHKSEIIFRNASDAAPIDLEHENGTSSNIKILAKIEDYACCMNDIYEIIAECDGILIDPISLLHSYSKYHNVKDLNCDSVKEKIGEIMQEIIAETKKQAKPYCLCCDILAKQMNEQNVNEIEKDFKFEIRANSFLSFDDILSIEYCAKFGADSICLLTDLNRLKSQFNDYFVNDLKKRKNAKYGYSDNDDLLYLNALIRSVSNIIKKKEILSRNEFHSNSYNNFVKFSVSPQIGRSKENSPDNKSANMNVFEEDNSQISDYSDEARKIYEVECVINSMASSAVKSAFDLNCSLIIVLTQSGRIARIVSKYRPHCNILAITDSESVARQCMFISSIFPVLVLNMNGTDSLISRALHIAYKYKLIKKKGEKVVVLAGTQSDILDEPCDFIMKLLYVDL